MMLTVVQALELNGVQDSGLTSSLVGMAELCLGRVSRAISKYDAEKSDTHCLLANQFQQSESSIYGFSILRFSILS